MIPERPDSQPEKQNPEKIKPASGDRILFWCKNCGQKYHLPRYLAGKAGVCIKCNDYLFIPSESQTEQKTPKNIVFPCKFCGEKLKKPGKLIGTKVKCSKCGEKVVVPEKSQISALSKPGVQAEERILFWCTYCGEKYRLPKHLAGKNGNCDKCKHGFVIPEESEKKPKLLKTIEFPCEHCNSMLWEKHELIGKPVSCRMCGASVVVPGKMKEPALIGKTAAAEERVLFWCGICGQKYRLRKSHAGKSGVCDNCHNNFTIPQQSQEKPVLVKTVKFSCKNCGSKLQKPQDMAGQEVECYKCSVKVTIPKQAIKSLIQKVTPPLLIKPAIAIEATRNNLKVPEINLPKISLKVPEKITLKKKPDPEEERILFWCEYCGQKYRLRKAYAGRSGDCDKCHNKFIVPMESLKEPNVKETIVFSCEHCGEILRKEKKLLGMESECYACGGKVVIRRRRSVPESPDGSPIKLMKDEIVAETTRTSLVVVGRVPTQYLSKLKVDIAGKPLDKPVFDEEAEEDVDTTLTGPRILITEELPWIYRFRNYCQEKGEDYLFFALIAMFIEYILDSYGGGRRPSKAFVLFTSFSIAACILLGTWNHVTAVVPNKTSKCRYHIMCTEAKCDKTEVRRFYDLDRQTCAKCGKHVGLVYHCFNCGKNFPFNEEKDSS
jgi:DNA-directed RNA polymerase subunit RPC12/RpoP